MTFFRSIDHEGTLAIEESHLGWRSCDAPNAYDTRIWAAPPQHDAITRRYRTCVLRHTPANIRECGKRCVDVVVLWVRLEDPIARHAITRTRRHRDDA